MFSRGFQIQLLEICVGERVAYAIGFVPILQQKQRAQQLLIPRSVATLQFFAQLRNHVLAVKSSFFPFLVDISFRLRVSAVLRPKH